MKLNKHQDRTDLRQNSIKSFFSGFRPHSLKNGSSSTQKTNTNRQPLIIIHQTPSQRHPRQDTKQAHLTSKRRLQNFKQSHHHQIPTPHVKTHTSRPTMLNRRKKNTKPLTFYLDIITYNKEKKCRQP